MRQNPYANFLNSIPNTSFEDFIEELNIFTDPADFAEAYNHALLTGTIAVRSDTLSNFINGLRSSLIVFTSDRFEKTSNSLETVIEIFEAENEDGIMTWHLEEVKYHQIDSKTQRLTTVFSRNLPSNRKYRGVFYIAESPQRVVEQNLFEIEENIAEENNEN